MEAMLGISLSSYPYLNQQKCFVFLIIAFVFSSTKWRKWQNVFCLEARRDRGSRIGLGARGSNGPNNVCTCE
jgi:hypothetical protein